MSQQTDELQAMWRAYPRADEKEMTLADIRRRAQGFERRIGRRNRIEYGAGVASAGLYAAFVLLFENPIVRLGAALCVVGILLVLWQLHRRARAASREELARVADRWPDFHRAALIRQRDALRAIWTWYLGPLLPGLIILVIGAGAARPPAIGVPITVGVLVLIGVVFQMIASLNRKAAAKLQVEIDALGAQSGGGRG